MSVDISKLKDQQSTTDRCPTPLALRFLDPITKEERSERDKELARADARSHAAVVQHRKARALKQGQSRDYAYEATGLELVAGKPLSRHRINHHKASIRANPTPYSIVYHELAHQHTVKLLHHCLTHFWHGFPRGAATFHVPPFAFSFSAMVQQGPALFHALLWQSAVNLGFETKLTIRETRSLQHHAIALRELGREVAKPVEEINEASMYAMLSLTVPEAGDQTATRPTSAKELFQQPLATLSWIHVFGRQQVVADHVAALYRLVDARGIDNISWSGFSADLNYMDIIRSTQELQKPHFPVARIFASMEHTRSGFFGHADDFLELSGVESVEVDIPSLEPRLNDMLNDMRVWVVLLEAYGIDGAIARPDLSVLASHRDLLQHKLLTLMGTFADFESGRIMEIDAEARAEDSAAARSLDALVYTAMLIFSLGVTFPVTWSRPWDRLSARLYHEAQSMRPWVAESERYIFTWACMFGALCAGQVGNIPLEQAFVEILAETETIYNGTIRDFETMKTECLTRILWSDQACEMGARYIWSFVEARARSVQCL